VAVRLTWKDGVSTSFVEAADTGGRHGRLVRSGHPVRADGPGWGGA